MLEVGSLSFLFSSFSFFSSLFFLLSGPALLSPKGRTAEHHCTAVQSQQKNLHTSNRFPLIQCCRLLSSTISHQVTPFLSLALTYYPASPAHARDRSSCFEQRHHTISLRTGRPFPSDAHVVSRRFSFGSHQPDLEKPQRDLCTVHLGRGAAT